MTMSVPYQEMSSEPLFTKCCGCIPLRVGCLILGYLNLVFNAMHTLTFLAFTTYIGMATHGFQSFDPNAPPEHFPGVKPEERPYLNQVALLLIVVLCGNVAWLVLNIACLVGLHKKRAGPIRVYVAFATVRFLLSLAVFIYLMAVYVDTQAITHCIDLGLTAYFILVYYVYAVHLERSEGETLEAPQPPSVGDISCIYPPKIDKESLVGAKA